MTKFFVYAAVVISLGTTATLAVSNRSFTVTADPEARLAADGAFRDGLYLGKLAAQHSDPLHPAIGRWSNPHDRAMFAAGYSRGYNENQ